MVKIGGFTGMMKKVVKRMKSTKMALLKASSTLGKPLSQGMQDTLGEVIGDDVIPVVQYLRDKKNISEFKIAEDISAEVNAVRSMLYRLHSHNLVTYYRKKDRQKGWYISYWTFNPPGLKHSAAMLKKRKLEDLRERLKREEDNRDLFYMCPSLCTRMDFDNATDVGFKCPECGRTLTNQENSKTIALLRTKITELERQ
ncbi:hypothetical protein HYY72_01175 [Candidatus Woesearchaeota archaeon]|nr:hypothetical protein [Candidatus Woesearchaeota archaeon]